MRLVCIWYHASRFAWLPESIAEDPKRLLEWLGHNTETLDGRRRSRAIQTFGYDIKQAQSRNLFGGLILHGLAHFGGSFLWSGKG